MNGLLHNPLFWNYAVVAAFILAALLAVFQQRWITPVRRLQSIARSLAAEQRPRTFQLAGAAVFGAIAQDLERVFARQKRLAEELARENVSVQTLLRGMAEGMAVLDAQGAIREANDAFLRLFSSQASPLGLPIGQAVPAPELEEMLRETVSGGRPQAREISLPDANGEAAPRHFDVNAIPLGAGSVVVFHDISRLRQLEDVRREFVANVSHELRTPLSIFSGYVETLLDQPDVPPQELRRILITMRRHSLRLNALVDDLLTLARLEARRLPLERVSLRVEPFLRQIAADIAFKLEGKHIALVLDVAPDLPPLEADPFRLEQVIYNLLDNSIKYSEAGSALTLRAWREGEAIHLQVRDQGSGIPPADLPHIFERFYRVDKARSREGTGGTGLGLSIVKHIVQAHGGTVVAESRVGQGTAITASFPVGGEESWLKPGR
ncbi:MAG: ATP-binding protein [Verrucomicrobium sp.]|nr:ATP-binding protein [Verrucomicrobium sp.]